MTASTPMRFQAFIDSLRLSQAEYSVGKSTSVGVTEFVRVWQERDIEGCTFDGVIILQRLDEGPAHALMSVMKIGR